jgi:hypothetical protein
MLYESVNTTRRPQKATNESGTKKANLLKKTQPFWYQSIDKRHLSINVKFDGGLSIQFARELRPKKSGTFSKGVVVCPFSKWRGLKGLKILRLPQRPQPKRVAGISKLSGI